MVQYQSSSGTVNFVCSDRRSHTTPTNRYSTIQFACCNRPCKRDYRIRIIVACFQTMSTEVDDFMTRFLETDQQIFLENESTMIGGNSDTHCHSFFVLISAAS